ncbi:MAG: aspartate-semialdehyde dehydrogenase [Clostridia bacterium]|nr:aspartate-semialdehyde dehydrogenase [Clostridia bacterium]
MSNLAIIGASGLVGRKILEMLEEFNIQINNLYLFSSPKSAGKKIKFKGKEYSLIELNRENIENKKIDFALFSAGTNVSLEYTPIFVNLGAIVIDNSSYFRMKQNVPLIVPEVNPEALKNHKNIISNPNCSTIQAVAVLSPLHKLYKIKRIIFSTYQAVSGAGLSGIQDLKDGINGIKHKQFPHPIFNNILPHIDVFCVDGYTREEYKLINETKKILNDDSIKITATAARVPIFNCHCESLNIEFEKQCDISEIKKVLQNSEGIIVLDDTSKNVYPMPVTAVNKNEVFVGRIRQDPTVLSGVNLWIVADNIRKGAATNAVQILQLLIKQNKKNKEEHK